MWGFLKFGGEQNPLDTEENWALTRVRLADRFHWTFEYIDHHMTQDDLLIISAVSEADDKNRPKSKDKDLELQA